MDEEEVYNVEEILDSRNYLGKKQYYIKWEGYDHQHNTWEYEKDIFCKDLIQEYENKKKKLQDKKKEEKKKEEKKSVQKKKIVKKEVPKEEIFSEKEDEDKEIVNKINKVKSVYQKEGVLFFQVEYLDGTTGVFSKEEAHAMFPLKVIHYYEENLSFHSEENEQENEI
ncbi:Heterochromatin-associated CHROMO domain protein [Tubulinosema ratisbonensis]|uniref:Heterochromatin-associated CHROMO domain protein n=1 Tax=Tubulinosema ratisbonensis TaxID=291195 RepID=A0A437ANE2_9MICR|nr:Heterochromatin-associated CHROMO domain protein [Tubulinosema ratisbonensis]